MFIPDPDFYVPVVYMARDVLIINDFDAGIPPPQQPFPQNNLESIPVWKVRKMVHKSIFDPKSCY
jgi:hypothetical protein